MSIRDHVLTSNAQYASSFSQGDLAAPPKRKAAILTCMDARLHPERFAGFAVGDAHVIRNAGGRASDDAIRSLIISSRLLGTREFAVIHHTDCGMMTFTNDRLRARLREETGSSAGDAIDFLPFSDLEASVVDDVRRIREHPLVPAEAVIYGFVYDVRTGQLREVPQASQIGQPRG
jgi:carbonic anhydrase